MTSQWNPLRQMFRFAFSVLILASATTNAQTNQQSAKPAEAQPQGVLNPAERFEQKVFAIRHADPLSIAQTLRIFGP